MRALLQTTPINKQPRNLISGVIYFQYWKVDVAGACSKISGCPTRTARKLFLISFFTLCTLVLHNLCFYNVLIDCCLQGDGKIVLEDNTSPSINGVLSEENGVPSKRQKTTTHPVDLELEVVLGKMPQKVFYMCSV